MFPKGVPGDILGPTRVRVPDEFGGDKNLRLGCLKEFPNEAFASSNAVNIRGVKKINASVHRRLEGLQGHFLSDLAPVAAELPGPHADFRYGNPCFPETILFFMNPTPYLFLVPDLKSGQFSQLPAILGKNHISRGRAGASWPESSFAVPFHPGVRLGYQRSFRKEPLKCRPPLSNISSR